MFGRNGDRDDRRRAGLPVIDCRKVRERLPEYAAGRALPEEFSAMAEHLTCCEPCARVHYDLRAVLATLSRLPDPPSPIGGEPAARRALLDAAARRGRTAPAAPRWPWRPFPRARLAAGLLGAGALIAVAMLGPAALDHDGKRIGVRVMGPLADRPHPPSPAGVGGEGGLSPGARREGGPPPGAQREGGPPRGARPEGSGAAGVLARGDHAGTLLPPDDLVDLNGPRAGEADLAPPAPRGDDFVHVPSPRLVDSSGTQMAAALAQQRREAAVVDTRLVREVTLQARGLPLGELCAMLKAETGIRLAAGPSVADEKVSLFCKATPLRDVMRNLSRPFGYTWLRSGKPGEYRYEITQDLPSQLAEEELRSRARNAALVALDQEMQAYRRYQGMTPEQARAAARTAPPEEKRFLERYAGPGWAAIQMYLRLSPAELAALRAGRELRFSTRPAAGEQPLPADVARGALQSPRTPPHPGTGGTTRIEVDVQETAPGPPPAAAGEAETRPEAILRLRESERGQFSLEGGLALTTEGPEGIHRMMSIDGGLAVGVSPAARRPQNAEANAALAREPALQRRVTVAPKASCAGPRQPATEEPRRPPPDGEGTAQPRVHDSVTSADVLEALHRATGMPVVGDYYTRLHTPREVTVRDRPLFETLNRLADTTRHQWRKDGSWLQFRTASFYDERMKEVPSRLLERWSAARRERGALPLAHLAEITALSDAQLDASAMAAGARECYGLVEWDLARSRGVRSHLRFLASLTPAQWREVTGKSGLAFADMTLPQQQQYLALAFGDRPGAVESLAELKGAALQVDYTEAGGFEWRPPRSAPPPAPRRGGRLDGPEREEIAMEPAPVRERTREAALQAARRIDPQAAESQVRPTEPTLRIRYTLGGPDGAVPQEIVATPRDVRIQTRLERAGLGALDPQRLVPAP
jgi:hypothetical protein